MCGTKVTALRSTHDRTLWPLIAFCKLLRWEQEAMARHISLGILAFTALTMRPDKNFVLGYSAGSLIWSRIHESFVPIDNVTAFRIEQQNYLSRSLELEKHNFQREVLRATYYEAENIVHFYDNDTRITGVFGEFWNMLAHYLNFTMMTIKSKDGYFGTPQPNGSYSGLLGMLERNDVQIILRVGYYAAESRVMDYTLPVSANSYRLYIRSESRDDGSWIIRIFSRQVWFLIFLLFVFLSVLGCAMQKISIRVSKDANTRHGLHDHLFHTFATFCCQGFVPNSLYSHTKVLGFTKKIFAWLLLITVSSYLISFTTNKKAQPPFQDLNTMFNSTDYNIVIFNGSITYGKFEETINQSDALKYYRKRIFYAKSPQRLYEKGCWGKRKYAIMDSEDRQRAYGRLKCNLVATGEPYFPTWIAGGIAKTFKHKRSLDIGILKLSECGLMDRLKNQWLAISVVNVDPTAVRSVSFKQVSMLYAILCIGMVASVVVFTLENIVFLYSENRSRIRRRRSFYPRGTLSITCPPKRILAMGVMRTRELGKKRIDMIFQKQFMNKVSR